MSEQDKEEDLNNMATSYRAQTGYLTRTVKAANALVKEAALRPPSRVFLEQLKRALAAVRNQEAKCAAICEDIRDAQNQTEANKVHIKGCLTRDADRADEVIVAVTREMARCEIGCRPPVLGAPGPVGQAQRVFCKLEKDLKPQELTADMTPVEFAYWEDALRHTTLGAIWRLQPLQCSRRFSKRVYTRFCTIV
jgi:hypothetical protein